MPLSHHLLLEEARYLLYYPEISRSLLRRVGRLGIASGQAYLRSTT
jgi:hypothetical protein